MNEKNLLIMNLNESINEMMGQLIGKIDVMKMRKLKLIFPTIPIK